MKKVTILIILFISLFSYSFSQEHKNELKPFIDVTGTAELKVVPDEIYISITLRERNIGKNVLSISEQEKVLFENFKSNNLNTENLFLSNADSDLLYRRIKKDQSILQKKYQYKARNAEEVSKIFEILDEMEIDEGFVQSVAHSKRDSLLKEVRILAIKAAKEKAQYLLEAIGSKVGAPLAIQDQSNSDENYSLNYRANISNNNLEERDSFFKFNELDESIEYKKITISASYFVKFLIN